MAANKKPKKRYRPRVSGPSRMLQELTVRAVVDFGELVDDTGRSKLLMVCHASLEVLRTGHATADDMGNLEMLAMLVTVMCAAGIGKEYQDIGEQARLAVSQIVERGRAHAGKYRLAGAELGDIAHCIELHEQQLQMPEATKQMMVLCTNRALAELRAQAERYYKDSCQRL